MNFSVRQKESGFCIFYVCLFIIVLLFALVLIDTSNIFMYVWTQTHMFWTLVCLYDSALGIRRCRLFSFAFFPAVCAKAVAAATSPFFRSSFFFHFVSLTHTLRERHTHTSAHTALSTALYYLVIALVLLVSYHYHITTKRFLASCVIPQYNQHSFLSLFAPF